MSEKGRSRTCTATWGARPKYGPGDTLYCGLLSGHEGEHEDTGPDNPGSLWSDDNPYAQPDDASEQTP